jgi:uncharacterized membrane protein YbhN (UPF0104 family)
VTASSPGRAERTRVSTVVDAGAETRPPQLGPGRRWGNAARLGLAVLVVAAVVVVLIRERAMLAAGSRSVARADLLWLASAAAGTVLLWTAGTVSQLGSIPARVPVLRLFAVQFAGTFANHVLPGGAGGMAVNVRFLSRRGVPRAVAAGAVALNVAAGAVTHTALLVVAVLLAPASLLATGTYGSGLGAPRGTGPLVAAGAVVLVLLLAWVARRVARARWDRVLRQVRAQLAVLAAVLRTPARAAQLWLGSIAVPVLHCLILYAVLRSLGGSVPVLEVSVAYLVASSVSALLPSPGGFGALDIALVGTLVTVGAPAAAALATVLAYRLLTVWLPFLPGACVLAVLLHRKVI